MKASLENLILSTMIVALNTDASRFTPHSSQQLGFYSKNRCNFKLYDLSWVRGKLPSKYWKKLQVHLALSELQGPTT